MCGLSSRDSLGQRGFNCLFHRKSCTNLRKAQNALGCGGRSEASACSLGAPVPLVATFGRSVATASGTAATANGAAATQQTLWRLAWRCLKRARMASKN